MHIRGIRGATVVESNTKDAILNETKVLLKGFLKIIKLRRIVLPRSFFQ